MGEGRLRKVEGREEEEGGGSTAQGALPKKHSVERGSMSTSTPTRASRAPPTYSATAPRHTVTAQCTQPRPSSVRLEVARSSRLRGVLWPVKLLPLPVPLPLALNLLLLLLPPPLPPPPLLLLPPPALLLPLPPLLQVSCEIIRCIASSLQAVEQVKATVRHPSLSRPMDSSCTPSTRCRTCSSSKLTDESPSSYRTSYTCLWATAGAVGPAGLSEGAPGREAA